MAALNAGLAAGVDVVLAPLSGLPPLAGLIVVALVTAVGMLAVFKRTSDQARISAVKRSIHASLFEIRLFNDDLRAILRAQADILRHNATYLRLSLMPMLWVIVPLVLLIAQLQFHYGYAPLQPGERVLVKAQVRGAGEGVTLDTSPGLTLDTPAVWFPGAQEVVWRLRAAEAGRHELRVKVGSEVHAKSLQVGGGVVRRSPVRLERGVINQILYPSERPLPRDGQVAAITVAYAERDVSVFGWDVNWMVVYFALSVIFAFALRKPFGVTI